MNLIIFDKLADEEKNIVKKYTNETETELKNIEDLLVLDIFNNYKKITIYTTIKLGFVSNEFKDFIEVYIEANKNKSQIDVIFIENYAESAKIAIDWLVYLKNQFGLNLSVSAEISKENFSDDIEFIFKQKQDVKSNSDNNVEIYTDGACSGNPGAGGWGAILFHGNYKKEISGFEPETTNNKMEITAVIKALELLKAPCNVELYSDSAYVVNAIKLGWLENWKSNGWIGSDKKPVKNIEYWKRLDELMQIHKVNFNKVKGHSDNEFNNRCDELATGEIAKYANNI